MTNATDQANILANAKELKSAGMKFRKIFVRKDIHPAIQKETFRIKEAEKREGKPENAGRNVEHDRDTRSLMVNDQVADQFDPAFLPKLQHKQKDFNAQLEYKWTYIPILEDPISPDEVDEAIQSLKRNN